MATSAGSRNRAVPYINVTPLIDVLLVVLIIFMVVTPLKPSRFKADIPTQRDPNEDVSKLKPNPLTLVVSISTDLQLKLNQDPMGSTRAGLRQNYSKRSSNDANNMPIRSAWKRLPIFQKTSASRRLCL